MIKIIYLITVHNKENFLDFLLDHYFQNFQVNVDNIVISSANINLNFKRKEELKHVLIDEIDQYGRMGGCQHNVIKGLEYIKKNLKYDYVVNIEADNIFYDYQKLKTLIGLMYVENKHFIIDNMLIKEVENDKEKLLKFGTINIFSKKCLKKYFPFKTKTNFKRAYEDYMGDAIAAKNEVMIQELMIDFYKNKGLILDYEIEKKYFEEDNVEYHSDRFMKFGIINAFDNNFENFCKFLNRYK